MKFLQPWILIIATASILKAQGDTHPDDPFGLNETPGIAGVDQTTAEIAATTRKSLVVVTQKGRDGQTAGTGSGFVLSKDGLIATCAHVIGESRPVIIRFENGEEHEVSAIHAWDRNLELAILKIDAKGLTPLTLAKPDTIQQGSDVIAMGNPQGLEFSVVRGVV